MNGVPCKEGVVSSVPLDCGGTYIGQAGRCINDRLREHKNLVEKTSVSLPLHCKQCACVPLFGECAVISRVKDEHTREVIEALEVDRSNH